MAMEDQVQALQLQIDDLKKQVEWQTHIHRNVGADGNIYHYWSILPMIGAAAGIGAIIGLAINRIFK